MSLINKLFHRIYLKGQIYENSIKEVNYRKTFTIHPEASLNYLENTWFYGNVSIGRGTYFNGGRLITGENSKIVIGESCAIGHNVNMIARTHDPIQSTGPMNERPIIEKDIIIGDFVWIGTNVFIKEGVKVGNHSIIGANSVVTKDVLENAIVGGIPAKIIRIKDYDYK